MFIATLVPKGVDSAHILADVARGLADSPKLQENDAQETTQNGSVIIQSLVQLRTVEPVRRGQRHGITEDQEYCARMRDHSRRATRKGVLIPRTKQKICYEGCEDRWDKDEDYR